MLQERSENLHGHIDHIEELRIKKAEEKLELAPFIKHVKKFEAQTKTITELKKTEQKIHEEKIAFRKNAIGEVNERQQMVKDKHKT